MDLLREFLGGTWIECTVPVSLFGHLFHPSYFICPTIVHITPHNPCVSSSLQIPVVRSPSLTSLDPFIIVLRPVCFTLFFHYSLASSSQAPPSRFCATSSSYPTLFIFSLLIFLLPPRNIFSP